MNKAGPTMPQSWAVTNESSKKTGAFHIRDTAQRRTGEGTQVAAQRFEAMFFQMMIKQMRSSLPPNPIFSSPAIKLFTEMQDRNIANEMAKTGSLGIADLIINQIEQSGASFRQRAFAVPERTHIRARVPPPSQVSEPASQKVDAVAVQNSMAPARQEAAAAQNWPPDSPKAFIETLWPYAKKAAEVLGVSPAVLIAQSALETGWGKHQPGGDQQSVNLFGIKAGNGWQGERVTAPTSEYVAGAFRQVVDQFRSFSSIGEAFVGYVSFLSDSPRYQQALKSSDDAGFINALQKAGYATDPEYAEKVLSILDRPPFNEVISRLEA